MSTQTVLKPPRLRRRDLIGIVSPASAPSSSEKIEQGVRYLESLGYRTSVGKHASTVHGYLAGTDEQRAADLNEMLEDRNVKAVFAVRGGYGTPRLLPRINYAAVKRNPKIVVGYSDLTALQLALFKKTGLVTFSGPMVGVEMSTGIDPYTEEHFWRVLTSTGRIGRLPNPADEPIKTVNKGAASGRLLGGNFSLLISLLGTPFLPSLRNALLVLEEVDEAPHRVDRMFAHLVNARVLQNAAGVVLGKFTECEPKDPSKPHLPVDQVLDHYTQSLRTPTIANLQYGHIPKKLTLPLGVRARLDAGKGVVEILEGAVRA